MRLLLDTHAFLWWMAGDTRLSKRARAAIDNDGSEVHVSAATAWEIATKTRLGKLPDAVALTTDIVTAIASQGFRELPVAVGHAHMAGSLPGRLQDPFDRMLIAQAMIENMPLVTIEGESFAPYAVKRLW